MMAQREESVAKASLVVSSVVSDKADNSDCTGEQDENNVWSRQQHLSIQVKLPNNLDFLDTKRERIHLVLVVDTSGSMSGNPWKQVQLSLKDILSSSLLQQNLKTDLITYADRAKVIEYTSTTYERVIENIKTGGCTDFKAAFTKVNRVVTEADSDFTKTVIVFMTDGQDTVNDRNTLGTLIPKLSERFQELNKNTVIHTVGFSTDHDFEFLRKLAELGGGHDPGMFRYCEPGDNREALKSKLEELFDFILFSNARSMDINIVLDDDNFVLGFGKPAPVATVKGLVMQNKLPELQEEATRKEDITLSAEVWLQLMDPQVLPIRSLTVKAEVKIDDGSEVREIPCTLSTVETKLLQKPEEKALWRLQILSRNVEALAEKVGKAISNNEDVSKLQQAIEKYQRHVSHTLVFGDGITKTGREAIFGQIRDIQKNLDSLQNMVAQYLRGGTQSISLLARAHDMRYQTAFSKSRRQRMMDKRAAKNMTLMQASAAENVQLCSAVDKTEVKQLSEEALAFFFCMLSQNTIADILLGDDFEDAIGFGLAVKRNEVVLDDPTAINIQVVSGTLVSRTSMLDALQYKIDVRGHLKAHGGFSFDNTPLGVTTIGMSREPINAWLPLYVSRSHWNRVKVMLKPALGSFCTLDPLGYNYKQMDVLFLVLGQMIGQLSKQTKAVSEHQLKILFAFQRTCAACIDEFSLGEKLLETVKNFLDSPAGRTKDIISQLYTLIGYMAALPTADTQKLLEIDPTKKGERDGRFGQFWMAFVTECVRRAGGSIFREISLVKINGLINALLHGVDQDAESSAGGSTETKVCSVAQEIFKQCQTCTNDEIDVPDFDPSKGVKVTSLKLEKSMEVDRAMEVWAQTKCGIIKDKHQNKKVADAKKKVKKWLEEGHVTYEVTGGGASKTEAPDTDGASEAPDGTQKEIVYDCNSMTTSMVQVLAKVQHKLCRAAFPHIASIPGCIAFLNTWLSRERNFDEIDANSGIPPDYWITEMKDAIQRIHSDMEKQQKFTADCEVSEEPKPSVNCDTDTGPVTSGEQQVTIGTEVDSCQHQETPAGAELEGGTVCTAEDLVTDKAEVGQVSTGVAIVTTKEEGSNDSQSDDDLDDVDVDVEDEVVGRQMEGPTTPSVQSKKGYVTLPMIFGCIHGNQDFSATMRAIICQAIKYHSNSQARSAIADKKLLDLAAGEREAVCTLVMLHTDLEEYRTTVIQLLVQQEEHRRANHCMLWASTVWAFIGYLMKTHKERGEGFQELVNLMLAQEGPLSAPYLLEKCHVILIGKFKDNPVIASGNQWLPEKKMAVKFKELLGDENWLNIETDLRSSIQVHVYRESDIPNRQGHCNSNPFIPNELRRKLGMELLPADRISLKHALKNTRR